MIDIEIVKFELKETWWTIHIYVDDTCINSITISQYEAEYTAKALNKTIKIIK